MQNTSDAVPDPLLVSSLAITASVQLASYCLIGSEERPSKGVLLRNDHHKV